VFAFFEQAARLTGGTLRFRLHDVLVGDRYAAAVATYRATRPYRAPLENNFVQLMRIEDGRVVERNNHDNAANKPARTGHRRSLLTYQ
jgi:ketosteroid isomerase-like protein